MRSQKRLKIGIVGLGLMGGSLGMALVRAGYTVSGWDQSAIARQEAYRLGALSRLSHDLRDAVSQASVVFIATPVESIPATVRECIPHVKQGTIFTDLGSIKQNILEEVYGFLPEGYHFVAGHPMTGSEQQGIGAADPFLFQNAAYVIIEDPRISKEAAAVIDKIIQNTGAQIIKLAAVEHDRIVGMVSHLPHLVAATLANTAANAENTYPGTLALAAGGFRDTTRIALGAPEIWRGIIWGNLEQVLKAIDAFQTELDRLKEMLRSGNQAQLDRFLAQAQEIRRGIPAKNKGFLSLLHELVVTIEDRPGAIVEVLIFLAEAGLNIKDIEILRIREGTGGTLRLALESDAAVDQAVKVLETQGFTVRKR